MSTASRGRRIVTADPPPDASHGGAIVINGPGQSWGIVHIAPEPGVCSVVEEGCGYCIGVPCKWPAATNKEADRG
jgi:hypothetical protein